jgi:hypothetical protein
MQAFAAIALTSWGVMWLLRIKPPRLPAALRLETWNERPAGQTAPAAPVPSAPPAAAPRPEEVASRAEAAARGSPVGWIGAGAGETPAPQKHEAARPREGRMMGAAADEPGAVREAPMRLQASIYKASDGDVILVPPGRYDEALAIGKSLTLRGTGATPSDVLIAAPVMVNHASVRFENLKIAPAVQGGPNSSAIWATSAKLTLDRVVVVFLGVAVKAGQSQEQPTSVRIVSSELNGEYADLLVRGSARVELVHDRLLGGNQAIAAWRDVHVSVDSCRFAAGSRIYAAEDSAVAVRASPTAPRRTSIRSAEDARIDHTQFADQTNVLPPMRLPNFLRNRR